LFFDRTYTHSDVCVQVGGRSGQESDLLEYNVFVSDGQLRMGERK
jgi:hypothetical protein